MRVKLTAKHPRPASSERAPVRSGSASARKPSRPAGPQPSTSGPAGTRGQGAGASSAGGKRPAGARGTTERRDEGTFARGGDAGAARRAASDRPPRRESTSGAPQRRPEASSERGTRRDGGERAARGFAGGGERGERAPRRSGDERGQGAGRTAERGGERGPRRFDDRAGGGERVSRRFEDRAGGERTPRGTAGERAERGPRRFEDRAGGGERAARRFEDRAGGERAPRGPAGERAERGPRRFEDRAGSDERGPRRFEDRAGGERTPRGPAGERAERGERSFARPVKSGYGERADRPARAPRDEQSDGGSARREFGDRTAARSDRSDRTDRGTRSFDKAPAAARRPANNSAPRAGKPRSTAPAGQHSHADTAPRTPRRDIEDAPGTLRLSKLMSELGLCSRREADEWIEKGWVLVDGERIDTLGTKVRPDQRIEIDPAAEAAQASQVTVLIHKTVGYVSGQAEDGYQPAITLVTPENRWEGDRSDIRFSVAHLRQLAPAGRLDIDSTGLLVLTQDGRIAKQLIGGHSEIDKEYLVRVAYGEHTVDVESHFPPESLALLRHGLSLDDVPLKPAQVSWQNGEQLRFVLREGKKRQIRRMCELVGLEVIGLKRVRMGRVMLGALPPGQWRYLGPDESF
ncbi:pseudouridine synthase [Paraburkholderia phenoliruptrix]|uniref:pseudouridine synthase n=1 Tax=Paraburkholderia phenoliruptrix TaxID=252970 RepID=UPI002925694C|nr:S4 domain-containing protein [Paraburkholderia phenoliruptrix]